MAIGDTANNAFLLKKIVKNIEIDIINFPRIGNAKFTYADDVQFFESHLLSKQIKKINEIKSKYDLCFVCSWEGARVAFLSNLNYVFFFTGSSADQQPFIKNAQTSYLKEPIHKKNFFERWFLKQVLTSAKACVTYGGEPFVNQLKKFHSNVYRMDMFPMDEMFLKKHTPINKEKQKFTFLSPQRQGLEKGMDIIWKAIELSKSDFVILQVDWFDRRTSEESRIADEYIKNKPEKMKFIPIIKWEEISRYYTWADAVMGQMRWRHGSIEREAVICGTPVLNYCDINETYLIDGIEHISGFLPRSNDPKELAKIIDKIVEDKYFGIQLQENELEFVNKLTNQEKIVLFWERIFEENYIKLNSIHRKRLNLKILNLISYIMENLIYKKKWNYKKV